MATADIERLHYYQRQFLGAADFEAEQTYLRDMRRRHNVGQHTQGIVVGLELVEQSSPGAAGGVDVFIQPGMAVDGYGREIFVLAPTQLDPALFDSFLTKGHRAVYIEYLQQAAQQPQAGYRVCETADQYARLVETFQPVIEPKGATHDPVIVGGKSLTPAPFPPPNPPPPNPDLAIPPDESVPYQELPDDQDSPKWLIRLGSVLWDGPNRQFASTTTDHYFEKRVYAGVIADRVLAPDARLTISPRAIPDNANPADFDKVDFLAEVRGKLQVDGALIAEKDVEIHGGKLSFFDAGGSDGGVPLWMQRMAPPSGPGVDLRVHIGDTADAKNRLSIGPKQGSSELSVLAVRADNVVKIETGKLEFGNTPRQMINLSSSDENTHEYGIGVQAGATYFRSDREFYWYKGGDDSNSSAGNPGPGGAVQLRLDDFARLHFGDKVRQMLNLWNTQYAIGIQGWTMYFRTDFDFCWFRGGVHSDNRSEPGAGGSLVMKLDDTDTLTLNGTFVDNGDARIGGNLRVGGATNLIKVAQRSFALRNNNNADTPRTQHVDYSGENFDQVYSVFAVMQGFSLFDNEGNLAFNNLGHVQGVRFIPQHAYVRVTTPPPYNTSGVDVQCFCTESDATAPESDNTILFTVIIIGRTAA